MPQLSLATVGAPIKASFWNLLTTAVNASYGTAVIPTSLNSTGGTNTISARGRVNISGATNVRINGFGTTDYADYELDFKLALSGTVTAVTVIFSHGGTDTVTNYAVQQNKVIGAAVTNSTAPTGTFFNLSDVSVVSIHGRLLLTDLTVAAATRFNSDMIIATSTTTPGTFKVGGQQNGTTVEDGINIGVVGGGTMTGTVKIRGLNDGS